MGFLDKAKQQAQELKGKVEGKVEDVQGKRKATDLCEQLGRLIYAQRTDRPVEGESAEIDRLVGELQKLEAEGVAVLAGVSVPADGASGATPSGDAGSDETASGDAASGDAAS